MTDHLTYKGSGVDVTAGYEAVRLMKEHTNKTLIPGVLGGLGNFGGMFELPTGSYENPVLISGTDGVGTKLKIAFMMDRHDTIGIDCVAMCVNDVVCHGAKPLFFLDYLGTGRLEPKKAAEVVKGISLGCIDAGCALIGGETAEMPGFYDDGEYDLAGFCVGIAEKQKIINGSAISPGDVIIGIASSGLHSNGYSLVRKVFFSQSKYGINTIFDELEVTLGEELLKPTRIYVKTVLGLAGKFDIKGIAHITGGGFIENIPRTIPEGFKAVVRTGSYDIPPVFNVIQRLGAVEESEMYNTFNMGIGMILIASEEETDEILRELRRARENAYIIGNIVRGEGGVKLCGK